MTELVFTIRDMDCQDEVAALTRALVPLVGQESRLTFDVLRRRLRSISRTGGEAEQVEEAVAAPHARRTLPGPLPGRVLRQACSARKSGCSRGSREIRAQAASGPAPAAMSAGGGLLHGRLLEMPPLLPCPKFSGYWPCGRRVARAPKALHALAPCGGHEPVMVLPHRGMFIANMEAPPGPFFSPGEPTGGVGA
jgi:hypothetical protein